MNTSTTRNRALSPVWLALTMALLTLAECWIVTPTRAAAAGRTSTLDPIYRLYYYDNDHDSAIVLLNQAILSRQIVYTAASMTDTVFHLMGSYCLETGDTARLTEMVYSLLTSENCGLVAGLTVSTCLKQVIKRSMEKWYTPTSVSLSPITQVSNVNSLVELKVTIRNGREQLLPVTDKTIRMDWSPRRLLEPAGHDLTFKAVDTGVVIVSVGSPANAVVTARTEISILPDKSMVPVITNVFPRRGLAGTTLSIRGNYFDAEPLRNGIAFGSVAAVCDSVNDNRLFVSVPSRANTGPITVTSPKGVARSAHDFVVLDLPKAPSTTWPLVSSGVFVASSLTYILSGNQVEERYYPYSDDPSDPANYIKVDAGPSTAKKAVGIVALISAGTSLYLWLDYASKRRDYNRQLESVTSPEGFGFAVGPSSIMLCYHF